MYSWCDVDMDEIAATIDSHCPYCMGRHQYLTECKQIDLKKSLLHLDLIYLQEVLEEKLKIEINGDLENILSKITRKIDYL